MERPFECRLVTDDDYSIRLIFYIHQNHQKHGLADDFRRWLYSSFEALVSQKPTRMEREQAPGWFGGREEMIRLHREMMGPLEGEDFSNGVDLSIKGGHVCA